MMLIQRMLATIGLAIMAVLTVGIAVRGKIRQSVAFFVYISFATAYVATITLWPDANTPEAYSIKTAIYHCLFFLIALEIGFKAFGTFAGIASRVKMFLALAVSASTAFVLLLTPQSLLYSDLGRYEPPLTTAAIWCLSFVALLVVWYQVPVPPFTRSLLLSFVPYLTVFVLCGDWLARSGWGAIWTTASVNALAYDIMATYLALAAWRKD